MLFLIVRLFSSILACFQPNANINKTFVNSKLSAIYLLKKITWIRLDTFKTMSVAHLSV